MDNILDSCSELITAITYGTKELSLDPVVNSLRSWEIEHKQCGNPSELSEGLYTKRRMDSREPNSKGRKKSRSKSRSKRNITCYHYHKEGHIGKECLVRKGKKVEKEVTNDIGSIVLAINNFDNS